MDKLKTTERAKYTDIWSRMDYSSPGAKKFGKYINRVLGRESFLNWNLLEIGAGNLATYRQIKKLHQFGHYTALDIADMDISEYSYPEKGRWLDYVSGAAAWELSEMYTVNTFHCSFSTDVLEHLPPEKVDETIKAILEVTEIKTIHCISTAPSTGQYGHDVHLTVKNLDWWRHRFNEFNTKAVEVVLLDPWELRGMRL